MRRSGSERKHRRRNTPLCVANSAGERATLQSNTPDRGDRVHIHLPKAIHGWREFAKEIVIIVIGVLIALGFEQVVEWLHWREKVADGEERLKLEGQQLYTAAAEQIALGPCANAQFEMLMQRVARSRDRLEPAPRTVVNSRAASRVAYAMPEGTLLISVRRFMSPGVWDSLKQEGVVLRMPVSRQRRLAIVYTRVGYYNEAYGAGATPPDTLAMDIPLDPAGRIALLNDLSQKRLNQRNLINYAIQVASGMRDLGYAPAPAQVDADIAQVFGPAVDYCRKLGHPLAEWQAVIAREPTLAQRGY